MVFRSCFRRLETGVTDFGTSVIFETKSDLTLLTAYILYHIYNYYFYLLDAG